MRLRTQLAVVALVSLAASTPRPAAAQTWNAQQLEVLRAIENCWNVWSEAARTKNYELWSGPCLASDQAKFWWAASVAPWTSRGWRRGHAEGLFMWGLTRDSWTDMRPLSITIEGDFAFVYYAPAWQEEDAKGEVRRYEQKRLEILRKVDGRWKFYGGMGAPSGEQN